MVEQRPSPNGWRSCDDRVAGGRRPGPPGPREKEPMKRLLAFALSLGLVAALAVPAFAGTLRGTDDTNPYYGPAKYLFNDPGFHLWFTAQQDLTDVYVAGEDYHNIYKYSVDDPENWCYVPAIPDQAPWNIGGHDGDDVYYKIWNVTTESWICGSDG
jgi:hypothetical protein